MPPFGGFGATYTVHLWLVGKRVVDFKTLTYCVRDGSAVKELKVTKKRIWASMSLSPDLKPSTHCGRAAAETSSLLGLIRARHYNSPVVIAS